MPIIQIKALPFAQKPNMTNVLEQLTTDFETSLGIGREQINIVWQWIEPNHYAAKGVVAAQQAHDSHPLLVEIIAPDFSKKTKIAQMLICVVNSLAASTGLPRENVYAMFREIHTGCSYHRGEIVKW
ncbi:MAG: hypothetical protein H0W44_03305 [Gammaproteobacteria bacterium]|nr:hypothetical protein [Gammaproteobacteria bacterium]